MRQMLKGVLVVVAGAAVCMGGAWSEARGRDEAAAASEARVEGTTLGLIEIEGKLTDRDEPAGLLGGGKDKNSLRQVLAAIRSAGTRAEIGGLVIRLKDAELTGTHVQELGEAIGAVRKAGKKVHLYSENFGTHELLLGSYADEVIAQAGGGVSMPGVQMDEMFLADMFAWVGVRPDFVQIGDYKGASEMFAQARPTQAWNENINALLDAMYGQMREELKRGRKMDDKKLDAAMEQAWEASAEDAKKAGLVDTVLDLPDMEGHLAKAYGGKIAWNDELLPKASEADLAGANPFTLFSKLMTKTSHEPKRSTIAVLHIDGAIVDGDSTSGGIMSGASVGSRTIRRALHDIEESELVKGVVIRIDSPGGSAIASEIIWQGVRRVAAKKPVWVSVGGMAASGGYYILVAGDRVYVNPSSIVGSIGVVGGKFALGGLMEKLHINTVSRSRGPRAAMNSMTTPWSDADKALVRAKMTETYDLFTKRVSAGRKGIELSKTAEGRLFVGQKAVDMKMADRVGGIEDALNDLAAELKLSAGSYDVMDYPPAKDFAERIHDMLEGFGVSAPLAGMAAGASPMTQLALAAREVLGERAWLSVRDSVNAMMQMRREPVLLISPRVLIVR